MRSLLLSLLAAPLLALPLLTGCSATVEPDGYGYVDGGYYYDYAPGFYYYDRYPHYYHHGPVYFGHGHDFDHGHGFARDGHDGGPVGRPGGVAHGPVGHPGGIDRGGIASERH